MTGRAQDIQLICDQAEGLDIRELIRLVGQDLPEIFNLSGERIATTWTQTNFGGRRQWFLCPSCDRRCAIIYFRGSGPLCGCRICMNGRYAAEHRSPKQRRLLKAFKTRRRLGQPDDNILQPFPERPKYMRWGRYERIRHEALGLEHEILVDVFESDLAEVRKTKGGGKRS